MKQVWCVAYDSHVPSMDGSHPAQRTQDFDHREQAERALETIKRMSHRSPKKNLRIETREVSEWRQT